MYTGRACLDSKRCGKALSRPCLAAVADPVEPSLPSSVQLKATDVVHRLRRCRRGGILISSRHSRGARIDRVRSRNSNLPEQQPYLVRGPRGVSRQAQSCMPVVPRPQMVARELVAVGGGATILGGSQTVTCLQLLSRPAAIFHKKASAPTQYSCTTGQGSESDLPHQTAAPRRPRTRTAGRTCTESAGLPRRPGR